MGKVLFLFIAFCLIWSFPACQAQNKSTQVKSILDTLNSPIWQKQFMSKDLENIITQLFTEKPQEAGQAVLNFALKNEQYRNTALGMLTRLKYSGLGIWLKTNRKRLAYYDWEFIYFELSRIHFEWKDTNMLNILKLTSVDDTNPESRHWCLIALDELATLGIAKSLIYRLKVEDDQTCRRDLYMIFSRYKYPEFDSIIKRFIVGYNEHESLNDFIQLSMKNYNRYDLLPSLYSLRSRLQKVTDVTKKSEAKETLDILKEVIPYLEQKKSEKAAIGLPLDWGK